MYINQTLNIDLVHSLYFHMVYLYWQIAHTLIIIFIL